MTGIKELSILRAYLRTLALPNNLFETSSQNYQDSLMKIIKLSELSCDFINNYNYLGISFKNDKLCEVTAEINDSCHTLLDKISNYEEPTNPDFVINTGWVQPASEAYSNLIDLIYKFILLDNKE